LRQIGTLPKGVDPKVFADYLLTLGIKTRVDERPDGWHLWIYNEDHIGKAGEELRGFLTRPDDPRFQKAVDAAEAIRRRERDRDREYQKNFRDASDLWGYPSLHRRPLTLILVGICVVVFIMQESPSTFSDVESLLCFSNAYLGQDGMVHVTGLNEILPGQMWRLVTPIFLHFGIFHLLFNTWALSSFGTMIEIRRGTLRLAGLVLISAVASNLGQFFYMERVSPGVPHFFGGISGVVCALFGYIWMKGLYEPEQGMILHPNSITMVLIWLALCLTGWMGPIANAAHVVGLLVGVALGVVRY
jgi:GlpG protein